MDEMWKVMGTVLLVLAILWVSRLIVELIR